MWWSRGLHNQHRRQCLRAASLWGMGSVTRVSKGRWDALGMGWPQPFSGLQPPLTVSVLPPSDTVSFPSYIQLPKVSAHRKKDNILEATNIQGIYISASYACTFVIRVSLIASFPPLQCPLGTAEATGGCGGCSSPPQLSTIAWTPWVFRRPSFLGKGQPQNLPKAVGSIPGRAAFLLPATHFSLRSCALAWNLKGIMRPESGLAEKPKKGCEIIFPFN